MSKLIPKFQSPWTPINYEPPENFEPKSTKYNTKILPTILDVQDERTKQKHAQMSGMRHMSDISQKEPVSGTDPVGEFIVAGEVLGGLSPLGKILFPYAARFTSGPVRNWIASKALNDVLAKDALTGGVNKVVQNNGNILLQLASHSARKPRQLRIEPQGNNAFRVHASTWGGLTDTEKKQLYEALYKELPENAKILFPESNPDYLATRGTVASLLRLKRDPRFTPGSTLQKLMYKDKDGSIKFFEGTSFTKKPTFNSISYAPQSKERVGFKSYKNATNSSEVNVSQDSFNKVLEYKDRANKIFPGLIQDIYEYMPTSAIATAANRAEFTPMFYIKPGGINSKFMTKEYLYRLSKAGYPLFETIPVNIRGFTTLRKPFTYITENNNKNSILGFFKDKNTGGAYATMEDISMISPETNMSPPSIAFHERNMHGTDNIITALNAWKPYQNFLDKLYYNDVVVDGQHYSVPHDTSSLNLLKESANKEELRATVGEYVRKLYDTLFKGINNSNRTLSEVNPEELRPKFEAAVDKMNPEVLKQGLSSINGYGNDYVKLSENNPNFTVDLKSLIKQGYGLIPLATVPLINQK